MTKHEAGKISITVSVEKDLYQLVATSATAAGLSVEAFTADCVAQSMETALRHRVVLQRADQVDEALINLAQFLGDVHSAATNAAMSSREPICKYAPSKDQEENPR